MKKDKKSMNVMNNYFISSFFFTYSTFIISENFNIARTFLFNELRKSNNCNDLEKNYKMYMQHKKISYLKLKNIKKK